MWRSLGSALALGFLLSSGTAAAAPLTVKSGTIVFTDTLGTFHISGDGFELSFGWFPDQLSGIPFGNHCPSGCASGTTIDFGTTSYAFAEISSGVSGTVNGATYAALFPEGTLTFSGPEFVAPEFRPGLPISPQGVFSFHGNISVFIDESQTGPPVFSSALTGRGITTVFGFVPSPGAPFVLEPGDDVHYTFDSAIPEPSTLVMFGSGLIGAAVRWRRRRDRRAAY
jgi:hypothetical protein